MHWYEHIFGEEDPRAAYNKRLSGETDIDPNEPTHIEAGTKLYRTSLKEKDSGKNMYVTWREPDRNYYKKDWLAGDGDRYEQEMTLKQDLKGPPLKERQEICKNILQKDLNAKKEIGEAYVRRMMQQEYGGHLGDTDKQIADRLGDNEKYVKQSRDEIKNWANDYVKQIDAVTRQTGDSYNMQSMKYITDWIHDSPKLMQSLANECKKRGYNCIIDDHGQQNASDSRMTMEALIIFDTDKVADYNGAKKITDEDSKAAGAAYDKWHNKYGKRIAYQQT